MHSPPPRKAALVVNTKSRKGRLHMKRAVRELRRQGVMLTAVEGVKNPKLMSAALKRAVATSVPLVIVGGGDGSVMTAVEHLSGTGSALCVLPLGTANSFARSLGIPLDIEGATKVVALGKVRRVDLGTIDGRPYPGCASIGLAPEIAQTVPHGLKAWAGRPGYLLWAARKLAEFRAFQLTIEQGANRETFDAVEVRIANGPFHGGVEVVEDAELNSGRIVVQAVVGQKPRHLLLNWAAHLIGAHRRWGQVRQFTGTSMRISSEPAMPISIDGEVLARTPVDVGVKPGALLVMAPVDTGRGPDGAIETGSGMQAAGAS